MTPQEKHLTWFLRASALMFLAALPAIVMPTAWMRLVAAEYGLALPDLPLLEYLSRHLSAVYACMGASYWFISCDVRRYLPLIGFTVPLTTAQAVLVIAIDVAADIPLLWTVTEGASMIVWIIALWWLVGRVKSSEMNR